MRPCHRQQTIQNRHTDGNHSLLGDRKDSLISGNKPKGYINIIIYNHFMSYSFAPFRRAKPKFATMGAPPKTWIFPRPVPAGQSHKRPIV
jgi:hypothetical protein